MNRKSKGLGLGIALGAVLGVLLGVLAGHIALWLGIGVAIGVAIGSTLRTGRGDCPECAAGHKAHSPKRNYKGDENGATFGAR